MGLFGNIGRKKEQAAQAQPSPAPSSEAPETPAAPKPKRRRRRGPSISTIVMLVLILGGAAIIAYPTFADWWNSYHQSRAIATYVSAIEDADPAALQAMMDEAHAYNKALLSKPNRFTLSKEEEAEYKRVLDPTGQGIMGYVQVTRLHINYPIYHSVDEAILQVAIGHIEGTSLPVGGPSTHAAISGHRGLPSAKLFTDLDKMVEGDTFTITVLKDTLTYEVDQIRIVEPSDMSNLSIDDGKDYVTLVTCTPYGVNTHRLLVRGHRIANITGMAVIPAEAVQIPNYVAVPAVAVPMLFAYLVGALLYYRFKDKGYDRDKVMEELNELKDADHE